MPVGNVLVRNARSDIEHDDTALSVDVVAISETTKLLLTSSVPHVKLDLTKVLKRACQLCLLPPNDFQTSSCREENVR